MRISAKAIDHCSRSRATTRERAISHVCDAKQRSAVSDPDKWFNNVEVVVGEKIGIETTTYVRNIYKYYVSYKLTLDAHEIRRTSTDSGLSKRGIHL